MALKGAVHNPKGKGGFGDNPENRSDGRWKKEHSFTYWMHKFKSMTINQLNSWLEDNPPAKRTVAQDLAYRRVFNAQKELNEFKEVADRTEGKAPQTVRHEGAVDTGIEKLTQTLQSIIEEDDEQEKDQSDQENGTNNLQE